MSDRSEKGLPFPIPFDTIPCPMKPLALLFLALAITPAPAAEIHHAQGEMAGEPTANSVLLQSRLTAIPGPELDAEGDVPGSSGVACFEWSESADAGGRSDEDTDNNTDI